MISLFGKSPNPVWRALLIYKLVFYCFVLLVIELLPILDKNQFFDAYRQWPLLGEPNLESSFAAWDGAHYLYVSQIGYIHGSTSCAFYPLLPFLIGITTFLTAGNPLIAGLLLTNAFSILGLLIFYQFVEEQFGEENAKCSLLFTLCFPGALFFNFVYTEAVFFCLIMVFFTSLFRQNILGLVIAGFCLPLTKAIGIFCLLPLAYWFLFEKRNWKLLLTVPLAPILGYLTYFAIFYVSTGDALEGFHAQKFYPNSPSIANMFNLAGFIHAFASANSLHHITQSLLDRAFFVLFLIMLIPIFKLNRTLFWYALVVGLVPAMSAWFMSYCRNVMMCFPLFIALGLAFGSTDKRESRYYFLGMLAAIQIVFTIRFLNWYWTA